MTAHRKARNGPARKSQNCAGRAFAGQEEEWNRGLRWAGRVTGMLRGQVFRAAMADVRLPRYKPME